MASQEGESAPAEEEQKKPTRKKFDTLPKKQFVEVDEQETDDESVRSKTVFFEVCRIFLCILKNGDSSNLKVKHIALYKLFPRLVNISLPFCQSEHSEYYMRILVRGCKIEWGDEKSKINQFKPHLDLAKDLVKSGGLILTSTDTGLKVDNLKRVLLSFKRCYLDVSEKMKRDVL